MEPRWPAYHLSIPYLKGARIRSFDGSLVIVIRPPGDTVKLVRVARNPPGAVQLSRSPFRVNGTSDIRLGDDAALEPISMALKNVYGAVTAEVARGLALRMDHGTQYLSDHFLN